MLNELFSKASLLFNVTKQQNCAFNWPNEKGSRASDVDRVSEDGVRDTIAECDDLH